MNHFSKNSAPSWIPPDLALTERQFVLFRDLISHKTGISLRQTKGPMLSARLSRRLRAHNLANFDAYYQLLQNDDPAGEEHREFINCITTNKTSFFREPHHFEFLTKLFRRAATSLHSAQFSVWSAACSTGEEPYSIAMTLHRAWEAGVNRNFRVVASDIDTQVLEQAQTAIYRQEALESVPLPLRQKFFLRGSGSQAGHFRIKPALRDEIDFRHLNFIDPSWDVSGRFDAIFCRNAMIYFDQPAQDRILRRLVSYLKPNGHLIVGHSEHLHWMTDILEPVGTTIYQLKNAPLA